MSASKRSWIDIGSVLALIIGLGLVYIQIEQSSEITRVELSASILQNWRTVDSTRQGEEFATVLAKSIENPEDITLSEFLELDAYYLGVLDQFEIMANNYKTGFRETSLDYTISVNSAMYFGNRFAKAWLNRHFRDRPVNDEEWVQLLLKATNELNSNIIKTKYLDVITDLDKNNNHK